MKVKDLEINTDIVYVNVIGESRVTTDTLGKDAVVKKYGKKEVIEYTPWKEGDREEISILLIAE